MSEISESLDRIRAKLNDGCFSSWEREFLLNIIRKYDKGYGLTENQLARLTKINDERLVQGRMPIKTYR